MFAVTGRQGDRLTVTNLHDELVYEVVVSTGASAAKQAARGAWIATRVLPVEDLWLLSGMVQSYGPGEAELVGESLLALSRLEPVAPFRNPAKLAQARETVRVQHEVFCEMFAGDLTAGTGIEIVERYHAFLTECDAAVNGGTGDDAVDVLYQVVLDRPGFGWPRDGDALLRERKPSSFVGEDLPGLILLPPLAQQVLRRGA